MIGRSVSLLLPPERADEERAIIDRVLEGEQVEHHETQRVTQDGSPIDVALTLSPLRAPSGKIVGVSSIARDITARRRAEQAIRELNATLEERVAQRTAELQAANEELSAFAYSLAHDLRAPLRAINGWGGRLARTHPRELGDNGRRMLDRIRAGSTRMGELVDAMLLLSELTRRELSRTRLDLGAIAAGVVEELHGQDPDREVEFASEDGLQTVGDPQLARVLLANLLENAWKFTAPVAHARIELIRTGADEFAVRDNGVGFRMEYADLLFQPFARLHREDEFPGTGIGLATVERIVHRHGGTVRGEGTPSHGAPSTSACSQ